MVAAEAVACAARIALIHVFPLLAARSFWVRNAYRHQACTSRVLSKWVSNVAREVESVGRSSLAPGKGRGDPLPYGPEDDQSFQVEPTDVTSDLVPPSHGSSGCGPVSLASLARKPPPHTQM